MNSRSLAAFLSSIISQLLLLLFLLFPSSNPLALASSSSSSSNSLPSNSLESIFPLVHHFLSSSEIASIVASSRKRKRAHHSESDPESTDGENDPELGGRLGLGQVTRSPDSFKLQYKMTSATFEWLASLLEPLLECRDPVGSPLNLSPEVRLGLGLYRLATGSNYKEISDQFKVSEFAAKFCVKQLCRVLCTNFRFWVGFPSPNELQSVSNAFESTSGLPNCCGVISCTRFSIANKSDENESIAAQLVVDSSSRILSIVAGFRGDKDDWTVLKSSSLYRDIEGGKLLNNSTIDIDGIGVKQYLIGDSTYPLLPWLSVPYNGDPAQGSIEENFNKAHKLMRRSVVKTISCLKNWGVLSQPMEEEFKTAVAYIGACSILHNVLLMREDFSAVIDELGDPLTDDRGLSIGESSVQNKASMIRSALATKAKQIGNLDQLACASDRLQITED